MFSVNGLKVKKNFLFTMVIALKGDFYINLNKI